MNVKTRRIIIAKTSALLFLVSVVTPTNSALAIGEARVPTEPRDTAVALEVVVDDFDAGHAIYYPAAGGIDELISGYGQRPQACSACSTYHMGADFGAPNRSKVRSVTFGIVKSVGWESGLGYTVRVKHPILGKVETVYAHLTGDSSRVKVGQEVEPRTVLALLGQTGVATVPHLHFEVVVNGVRLNPVIWLKQHRAW